MAQEINRPINIITEAPHGWIESVLSDSTSVTSPSTVNARAIRWEQITGVKPQNSAFTLIIPIHNEQRFLPSFLEAMKSVNIPPSARVVFVTNACSDKSVGIVNSFLDFESQKSTTQYNILILKPPVKQMR